MFHAVFWNGRRPLWYPWLLVKSTEGMSGGLTGRTQKQGSAEAGSGGRKRQVFALFLDSIIAQLLKRGSSDCDLNPLWWTGSLPFESCITRLGQSQVVQGV